MGRGPIVLSGLLLLQVAALGARGLWSGTATTKPAASGTPILGGIGTGQVAQLRITDAQGASIDLARAGDGFVVKSAGDYPCKPDAVKTVLDKLLGLRSAGIAAANPRSHAGLEVAEDHAQRDVRLLDAQGKELAHLLVGRQVAGGSFVRVSGSDDVHRVDESLAFELSTSPSSWIDTQLSSFAEGDVKALAIRRASGDAIELEKQDSGGWRMKRPVELDAAKDRVEEVLRAAARVYLTKPLGAETPEMGLQPKPLLAVEATLKDGSVHGLEIGSKTPEGHGRYARKAGGKNVVEIAEYTAGALDKPLEHFKPAPPAPAPSPIPLPAPGTAPPRPPGPPVIPGPVSVSPGAAPRGK